MPKLAEAAGRLNLPADQFQFHFKPDDEKLLNLTEPHFQSTPGYESKGLYALFVLVWG